MKGERYARRGEKLAMAKRQQQIDEIANWEDIADEMPDLPDLVREFRDIQDKINELEARKKELSPILVAATIIGGKKQLACGHYKVNRISNPGHDAIVPEKLVEKGVDLDVIAYATKKVGASEYPLVTIIEEDIVHDKA